MAVTQNSRKSKKPTMIKSPTLNIDEQLSYAHYKFLKLSEFKKTPDRFYLQTTQQNLNIDHRVEVINRLLHLSDYYKFEAETIYSGVGYMDCYLSANMLQGMQELLLLGLACFIVAAKHHQSCVPSAQHIYQTFCYSSEEDHDQVCEFTNAQVLKMEEDVLSFLNSELTTPSAKDFLKIFVHAVIHKEMKGEGDVRASRFRCLTDYILELYLLDYAMLGFSPSMVAASVVFLGKFILFPCQNPWNSLLKNVTEYDAWELRSCIEKLHSLYCGTSAVKEKYRFVANISCAKKIDPEFF